MSEFVDAKEFILPEEIESIAKHNVEDKEIEEISTSNYENYVEDVEKLVGQSSTVNIDESHEYSSSNVIEKSLAAANISKEEGNYHFRVKDYDSAISSYTSAITLCPIDDENKESLSVFYGNRAAAYFSVEEYECVVDDCSSSLEINGDYVKVLMRRSQAYEKLTKPEDALTDAKKVLELDPSFPKINATVKRLEVECDERMTKMKDEALGKLKSLGNSILGNFGMSLDNFNMKQDAATGSWNIR
jgi:tetratricopeptide (TPR) repeat protein